MNQYLEGFVVSDPTQSQVSPTLNELPSSPVEFPAMTSFPTIAGHEILGELGRGGMGVVYRARQSALNRIVAIKMILSGNLAGEEARRRFRIEAEAVARLSHPHIVQVYEIGESDGCPYFTLEFVDGGSLEHHLRNGPMTQQGAAALIETLARAMHHAHQHGIIHRDLKPANVLLASRGRESPDEEEAGDSRPRLAKITDFGLARQLESSGQTQSGAVLGTPSYMAPEQAAGKNRDVRPATDVYALGAILYECLTGQPPFKGESTMNTLMLVLEQVPQRPRYFNRDIDSALESICLKCLEKEPSQRYPSAQALADDLAAYQHGEKVLAEQSGNLGLFRVLWQESRHTEVLRLAGHTWMAQGVVIFLIMLYASILQWSGVTHPLAYIPAAILGISGLLGSACYFRLRGGPPMTAIEWQTAKITMLTLMMIAVTIVINFLRGYAAMELFPLAVLEAGLGMGAVGVVLGGSLNFMPLACMVVAIVLTWKPNAGPILFGAVFGAGMFIQGWRYSRRKPN
jgi:serine/threonine-protein kinase